MPRGEVDDTRYEQLYSLLLRDLVRGPVVVQQFVRLGGIEIVCVSEVAHKTYRRC